MVQWLMSRFVGRHHRSNAFHYVSRLATINVISGNRNQFSLNYKIRLFSNARFTQLPEIDETKIVIKSDSTSNKKNIPPTHGKLVTILSIDGGGVRGIIAGVILDNLEKHLQVIYSLLSSE